MKTRTRPSPRMHSIENETLMQNAVIKSERRVPFHSRNAKRSKYIMVVICPRRSDLFGEHTARGFVDVVTAAAAVASAAGKYFPSTRDSSLYLSIHALLGKSGLPSVRESTNRGAPRKSIFKQYWKWFIYSPHKRSTARH